MAITGKDNPNLAEGEGGGFDINQRKGQTWNGREFTTYGGGNKTYGDIFRNRLLDQRSRIEFHYPGEAHIGKNVQEDIITFIPFYENPEIKESQTANYVEYNPIGRGGSLFAYTGTKSRKFKVSLTFTLPHLAMHDMGIHRFMRVYVGASTESKKLLFTSRSQHSNVANTGDVSHSLAAEVASIYDKLSEDPLDDNIEPRLDIKKVIEEARGPNALSSFGEDILKHVGYPRMLYDRVVDTLLFFIAVLRTSVVNKGNNPLFGPPLLRLNFGTLYQSVPCICKNYNISWEEKAGYDLDTLTPRRIKIALTLDEVRVGDFGGYIPGKFSNRDGLTGWESAIDSPYTTDPLNLGGSFGDSGAK